MSNWYDKWLEESGCTCPILDGWKVPGSGCPLHGLPDVTWEEFSTQPVDEVQKIKEELAESQFSLTLIRAASKRAIKLWQQKTGQELKWPDKASRIVWLMEENESLREQCQSALQRAQVAESYHEETKKEAVHEKDMRIRLVKEYGDKAAHWKAEWLKEAKRCQELERKLNDN